MKLGMEWFDSLDGERRQELGKWLVDHGLHDVVEIELQPDGSLLLHEYARREDGKRYYDEEFGEPAVIERRFVPSIPLPEFVLEAARS